LKNLPVGLLVDLYAPGKEQENGWDGIWRIEVGEGVCWDMEDTFMNSVKEVSGSVLVLVLGRFLGVENGRYCVTKDSIL
jgi:hypothetical protein